MAENVAIKAIDPGSVHQIQSGQVIVDLCSVAKELVENSIDAGATSIDVRFKNQGLDSIEVQDNGSGISPQNYESIARKHYTSKLSTYDDLGTLQTFGFRGEALSSLCALSNFIIVTCTDKEVPKAKKLEFQISGELKNTSVVSGQRGTTVCVEHLFKNLPVRRRELERNIKREWGKVVSLLNQYACVQTGIKFTVSQQPNKGRRMVLFTTKGNPTTRENIINVFGVKTMSALITMDLKFELESTTVPGKKWSAQREGGSQEIVVRGHVSRPVHGEGRQTPDRQMFYVNGRPCGLPQFAKVFNEVYRSYNSSQSPFIFADIQLDTHLYDVNVSPDKRTILLHDQGKMLDNLRESLIELFETQDVTIPVANQKQTPFKKLTTPISAPNRASRSVTAASSRSGGGPTPAKDTPPPVAEDDSESEPGPDDEQELPDSSLRDISVVPSISSAAVARELHGLNSLNRWVERRTADRDTSRDISMPVESKLATKDQSRSLIEEQEEDNDDEEEEEAPAEENSEDEEQSQGDSADLPEWQGDRLKGFQARLASLRSGKSPQTPASIPEESRLDSRKPDTEPPVPSIPRPSQLPPPKPNLISPARQPKRATQEVATITIGDHTVTSIIGSTAKRSKIAELPTRTSPAKRPLTDQNRTFTAPSFGGRLSQLFSATSSSNNRKDRETDLTTELVHVPVAEYPDYNSEEEPPNDDDDDDEEEEEEEEQEEDDDAAESAPRSGEPDEHMEAQDEEEETLFVTGDAPVEMEELEDDAGDGVRSATDADEPMDSVEQPRASEEDTQELLEEDGEYIDEDEKKTKEEKKVQEMIKAAEATASQPTENGQKRFEMLLKPRPKRKDATVNLVQQVKKNENLLRNQIQSWRDRLEKLSPPIKAVTDLEENGLEADEAAAEARLSLKISKADFEKMKIIGQFNLGFVLAVREAEPPAADGTPAAAPDDELFIIDQHASDEKYNFERLQASTVVQSQRLVQPKTLELTAVEEEIIMENLPALERNGFNVRVDDTGEQPVGSRCQLLSLPLSRETTFSLADLEELLYLLSENPTSSATTVPRPSKVRKMFAMRACRSSIMIGRALSHKQMEKVVRHMGEMEKPWNCPHGRPTMRHLCGLGAWEGRGWDEQTREEVVANDWVSWVKARKAEAQTDSDG
ncbi:hypothetical protein GQ53DRAFT_821161 [Thozetella sp. PMI_491]|nr:hypothetical protein GQ53DRAFT_821161 [Thozetella sp. PMI_491]